MEICRRASEQLDKLPFSHRPISFKLFISTCFWVLITEKIVNVCANNGSLEINGKNRNIFGFLLFFSKV